MKKHQQTSKYSIFAAASELLKFTYNPNFKILRMLFYQLGYANIQKCYK